MMSCLCLPAYRARKKSCDDKEHEAQTHKKTLKTGKTKFSTTSSDLQSLRAGNGLPSYDNRAGHPPVASGPPGTLPRARGVLDVLSDHRDHGDA